MNLSVAVVTEFDEENDPEEVLNVFTGPAYVNNFEVKTIEMDGRNALVVEYESPILEKVYESLEMTYTRLDQDEPEFDFVISYDYQGEHELDYLSFHFNQYLPFITGSQDISGFYDLFELDAMMIGIEEE